jgi:hypothetical protein
LEKLAVFILGIIKAREFSLRTFHESLPLVHSGKTQAVILHFFEIRLLCFKAELLFLLVKCGLNFLQKLIVSLLGLEVVRYLFLHQAIVLLAVFLIRFKGHFAIEFLSSF